MATDSSASRSHKDDLKGEFAYFPNWARTTFASCLMLWLGASCFTSLPGSVSNIVNKQGSEYVFFPVSAVCIVCLCLATTVNWRSLQKSQMFLRVMIVGYAIALFSASSNALYFDAPAHVNYGTLLEVAVTASLVYLSDARKTSYALVAALLLSCTMSIVDFLVRHSWMISGDLVRLSSLSLPTNQVAFAAMIGTTFIGGLAATAHGFRKQILLLGTLLCAMTLLLTISRTYCIAASIGFLSSSAKLLKQHHWLMTLFCLSLLITGTFALRLSTPSRIISTTDSNFGHIQRLRAGVSVFIAHPVTGVGLGKLTLTNERMKNGILLSSSSKDPLNYYILVLAESGLVGFLGLLGFIMATATSLSCPPQRLTPPLIGSLAAIAFACLFDTPFLSAGHFFGTTLLTSLLALLAQGNTNETHLAKTSSFDS